MFSSTVEFHWPVLPYSPIDALNRRAAAMGSPRYAQATTYANYNGHHVTLSWNDYKQYYVAEYFWAGRVVLGRGNFGSCLNEVMINYERGALGSSASINPREDDSLAIKLCEDNPKIIKGSLWVKTAGRSELNNGSWWTWRHQAASESARDMANPRNPTLIFDWDLMQKAESRNEYETMLKHKYGKTYGF